MTIETYSVEKLTPEEKKLLDKKFAQFSRLPKETNNMCPNYFNPYHDPRYCPGACRYCMWEEVVAEWEAEQAAAKAAEA